MRARVDVAMSTDVVYDEDTDPALSLLHLGLEISPLDKRDFRAPALIMRGADGSGMHDLRLNSIDVLDAAPDAAGLPRVHGVGHTLRVQTVAASGVVVERFYTPLDACDVIVTRTRVTNGGDGPLMLERIMSRQLDLPARDWDVVSFTGAWAREMTPTRRRGGGGPRVAQRRLLPLLQSLRLGLQLRYVQDAQFRLRLQPTLVGLSYDRRGGGPLLLDPHRQRHPAGGFLLDACTR